MNETRSERVFAPVGADGQVSVFVSTGAHVIADVFGWYSTASDAELFQAGEAEAGVGQPSAHHHSCRW